MSCQTHRVTSGQDSDGIRCKIKDSDQNSISSKNDVTLTAQDWLQKRVQWLTKLSDKSIGYELVIGFQRPVNHTGSPLNKTQCNGHTGGSTQKQVGDTNTLPPPHPPKKHNKKITAMQKQKQNMWS